MLLSLLFTLLPAALAAPLIKARGDVIPGKYIVKFKGDMITFDDLGISSKPEYQYSMSGFTGFAGSLTNAELNKLSASSQVEFIEQDAVVSVNAIVEQDDATWGLTRISHHQLGSTSYVYDDSAGNGTCAYVIDTGIMVDHPEFEGRATFLTDTSGENSNTDGFGHGTHVAGTIGSKTYGVAKKVQLFAVKVLTSDGTGTNSGVIAGIQYTQNDAQTRQSSGQCPNGVVSNMSLGGAKSTAVNSAAAALVSSGVFLAVAAGNSDADASTSSPASEPSVCTVGATDINDNLADFSNYGSLVDILAPGVNITSTWNDGGINTISGTSMATPHVAGLGAYLLGLGGNQVNGLCETIQGLSTKGAIAEETLHGNTVNDLAFNGATS